MKRLRRCVALTAAAAMLVTVPLSAQGDPAATFRAAVAAYEGGKHAESVRLLRSSIQQLGGTNPRIQSVLVRAYAGMDSIVAAKRELVIYRRAAPASITNTRPHLELLQLESSLDARIPELQRVHAQQVSARRLSEAQQIVGATEAPRRAQRQAFQAAAAAFVDGEFRAASASTDPAEMAAFVERYPESPRRDEAKQRIEELRWRAADSARTLYAVDEYLRDYPQGRFVAAATRLADNLTIASVDNVPTLAGFRSYLRRFPNGLHVAHARARIDALEETPVFRAAEAEARGPIYRYYALQRYLERYPSGMFAVQAKREMERILKESK